MQSTHRYFQKQFTKVFQLVQEFHNLHEQCCDHVLQFVESISKWDTMDNALPNSKGGAVRDRDHASAAVYTNGGIQYNIFQSRHLSVTMQLLQGCYMEDLERMLRSVREVLVDDWERCCDSLDRIVLDAEGYYARQHNNLRQWFKREDKHWVDILEFLQALRHTALTFRMERECKLGLFRWTLAQYTMSDADRRRLMLPPANTYDATSNEEKVELGNEDDDDAHDEDGHDEAVESLLKDFITLSALPKVIRSARRLGPWNGNTVYDMFCRYEYVDLDAVMASVQRADDLVAQDRNESQRSLIDLRTSPSSSKSTSRSTLASRSPRSSPSASSSSSRKKTPSKTDKK